MKRVLAATVIVAGTSLVAVGAVEACTGTTGNTQSTVAGYLGHKYACIATGGSPKYMNNEYHTSFTASGTIDEWGDGNSGTNGYNVGTYSIDNADPANITYTYGAGAIYKYQIQGTSSPFTFCEQTPGSSSYTVTVQTGHCT